MKFSDRLKLTMEYRQWLEQENDKNNFCIPSNPETFLVFLETKGLIKEKSEGVKHDEKYHNACGSCKYFEQAEITNKPWRKCQSVYKKGVHAGENRLCYKSMNKCCDYVRKEANNDENN